MLPEDSVKSFVFTKPLKQQPRLECRSLAEGDRAAGGLVRSVQGHVAAAREGQQGEVQAAQALEVVLRRAAPWAIKFPRKIMTYQTFSSKNITSIKTIGNSLIYHNKKS